MEHKGALPCSHEAASRPYFKSYIPSPHPILLRSVTILSPYLRLSLRDALSTLYFPQCEIYLPSRKSTCKTCKLSKNAENFENKNKFRQKKRVCIAIYVSIVN